MQKTLLLLLFICSATIIKAQPKKLATQVAPAAECAFQKLFSIKNGLTITQVDKLIKASLPLTELSRSKKGFKPTYLTGDSIQMEYITYKADSITCFKGTNPRITLEFADGKLYKAYIASSFKTTETAVLSANYKYLRNLLKKSWKVEEARKISGANTEGAGYSYFSTTVKGNRKEFCSLQYIKETFAQTAEESYNLEIIWAKKVGTRLKTNVF